LRILLEEAQNKGIDIINPGFFEDFRFYHDEVVFTPLRGHGQGMANALTTLM
jgi:hypothetical protein